MAQDGTRPLAGPPAYASPREALTDALEGAGVSPAVREQVVSGFEEWIRDVASAGYSAELTRLQERLDNQAQASMELVEAIARVRAIHRESEIYRGDCAACDSERCPCPTLRALDGV